MMCKQDTPANEQLYYYIPARDGVGAVTDGYDLNEVLASYVSWAENNAIEDGEYYKWSEDVLVRVQDDFGEKEFTVTLNMDSRGDGYDHGRFDYESTRI